MARFSCDMEVGRQICSTYKIASTTTDLDIGKPVKLSATDTVALCSAGDQIYGFIVSVEPQTADGSKVVTVCTGGRIKVLLSGAAAPGTMVQAAANTASGVAKAGAYGVVAAHTVVTATVKFWMVVSGAGTDGTVAVIEKQ